MNLEEFVNKIFNRFPPDIKGDDTYESLLFDYTRALDNGKEYEYDNAYIDLIRSYSFKTTPPPKIVIEILAKNEIKKPIEKKKAIEFENILADKFGISYEFALNCPFSEAIKILEGKGFKNVRYPQPIVRSFL